jgi:hypothetical protein
VEARRRADFREAGHGRVDHGESGGGESGGGDGDGDQMRTYRLVGQMAHHVRPATVSHGSHNMDFYAWLTDPASCILRWPRQCLGQL